MKVNYIVRIDIDSGGNGYVEYYEFETETGARDFLNCYADEIKNVSKIFKVLEISNAKP